MRVKEQCSTTTWSIGKVDSKRNGFLLVWSMDTNLYPSDEVEVFNHIEKDGRVLLAMP
jgi:hypothetical protein